MGLNLTSANHVVLLEPSMCPGVREQAIGRVFRLGQTRAVHVHHYFMRNTIEEQIFRQRGGTPRAATVPLMARGMTDGSYSTETRQDLIEQLI